MDIVIDIGGNTVKFNCGIVTKGEGGGVVFTVEPRNVGVDGKGNVARRATNASRSHFSRCRRVVGLLGQK